MIALSISKFEEGVVNEDAVNISKEWIAVSDGAGGGGVFADKWSNYLVHHIPEKPICDYQTFDKWIDNIWEQFYDECEKIATIEGGMLLNKFYDEGSFATLVAVWNNGQWISYGDSVAFCYDKEFGTLQNSFGHIVDFNKPPYLINCKDSTKKEGFKVGRFEKNNNSIVFATSDTFAHYILMMYKLSHIDKYYDELQEAISVRTKYSNIIKTAMNNKIDFEKDIINKILNCRNVTNFQRHLQSLVRKGLIGHDDYSLVIM